jgi:hypothetical protein
VKQVVFTALVAWLLPAVLWCIVGMAIALLVEAEWNLLVPSLFHGPSIDYLQAWSLYLLCLILFKLPAWPTSDSSDS